MTEVFFNIYIQRGFLNHSKLGVKLVQFILIVLLSAVLLTLLGILITQGDFMTVKAIKINQFFQHLGIFVIPSIFVAYLWSYKPFSYLYISKTPSSGHAFFAILIMITAIPAINLLGELNAAIRLPAFLSSVEEWMRTMEENAEVLTMQLLDVKTLSGLFVNLILIALLPAIGEELFFRGIIQNLLKERFNIHLAIWLTAIIFSAIHFQFYGFIPRALMGALFGYILWWTGSMWVPIISHFTNNALAVTFYFFYNKGSVVVDLETIGTSETLIFGILSLLLVGILIVVFKRHATEVSQPTD